MKLNSTIIIQSVYLCSRDLKINNELNYFIYEDFV